VAQPSTTSGRSDAHVAAPVPFLDLTRENSDLGPELDIAVREVVSSSRFVLGPAVERFEAAVADQVGVRHGIGVASGTDALFLALMALGIGDGDEVITSPFSFFSSATTVVHTGATPVFADIDPRSFNIDPAAVEAAITPRTAAIMPVHLYGQMADMGALRDVASRHGLAIVEDAAQAIGATMTVEDAAAPGGTSELRAGGAGTLGCFSFYPTKNLGGWGDGGMITTDDDDLATRIRLLRVHGCDGRRYYSELLGFNSRLDALQAAVLNVKLSRLPEWNVRRQQHAAAYNDALSGVPGITLPHVGANAAHTFHQYTIRCADRDEVVGRLERGQVGYAIYYPSPLHLQRPLAHLGHTAGAFPEAERVADEVVSLPIFAGLSDEERGRVIETIRG